MLSLQGNAKRRLSRDATSSKRQCSSSSSFNPPAKDTRSSTVDSAATTPWSVRAELANNYDQQLSEIQTQLFDNADVPCQEKWIRELPLSQINEWMEYEGPLDDHNIITSYSHGEGSSASPAVPQGQGVSSASSGSSNHSPISPAPYPSIEISRSNTRESCVNASSSKRYEQVLSQIRGQVLDCQDDPAWSTLPGHFRARLTSILEICTSQHTSAPPRARKSAQKRSPIKASQSNTQLSPVEGWYSRIMSTQLTDLCIPQALQPYLHQPPMSFLNPPSLSAACHVRLHSLRPAARVNILAKRILYMRTLRTSTTHFLALTHLNCVAFFLLSHGSLAQWKDRCGDKTAQKLWKDQLPAIFACLHPELPPADVPEAYAAFEKEVRGWQKTGALLAYLAKQIGLGAIVLLHDKLGTLRGASRGLERVSEAEVFGKKRPSEAAFDYLRGLGIVEVGERTGATAFVQGVLRELLKSCVGWERLGEGGIPGFDGN